VGVDVDVEPHNFRNHHTTYLYEYTHVLLGLRARPQRKGAAQRFWDYKLLVHLQLSVAWRRFFVLGNDFVQGGKVRWV